MGVIQKNKKAYFDYQILEKFEAGVSLIGQEVKSIRLGRVDLKGAFVILKNQEAYLVNANIPPYQPKNILQYDQKRPRKLLLKKRELKYLIGKSKQKGLTLIPLRIYTKRDKIKVEIGLVKKKKKFDKKELIKKREIEEEIRRKIKQKSF